MASSHEKTILLAGASRGIGLGLARAFLAREWTVIATARHPEKSGGLQELRGAHGDRLTVETLDVADQNSISSIARSLGGRRLDVLFVVAGTNDQHDKPIQEMAPEKVAHEFITNASGPVSLAETLLPAVAEAGTVAFMTSILGSIASNAGGGMDIYRASKAALNMLGMNFSIRHKSRPVLLLHPGWVKTAMGGSSAPVDVETSVRGLADIIERAHKPGVAYLDYQGHKLPW